MKLNVKACAQALGLVWGLIMMFMVWTSCLGWQVQTVEMMKHSYIGVESSFIGGVVAFAWGFVVGLVTGGLFAYFYNRLVGKK